MYFLLFTMIHTIPNWFQTLGNTPLTPTGLIFMTQSKLFPYHNMVWQDGCWAYGWFVRLHSSLHFSLFFLLLPANIHCFATVLRTRTGQKQRDNLDNKRRYNGNVCSLLLCCWLLLVPLVQSFKLENAGKQMPKIADQSTSLIERPRLNFFRHGYFVIYSITR